MQELSRSRWVGDPPLVCVIMPVRNEGDFIARSLGSVLEQDYPSEWMEVLVADGLSTDGTREEVARLAAKYPQTVVRVIDNPARIVPTGINAAMQSARGEIIVRVDGHCEVAPDYVRRCVDHLLHDNVDGVGGPIHTVGQTAVARAISVAMSEAFGVGGSTFRTVQGKTMLADTIPFPAYTRAMIERAGPYDEELIRNQDDEYNYRLRKLGAKLLLASDIRSVYYSRGSLRALARQYFQYGFWKVRVMQKHPRQMRLRHFIPSCLVAALFLLAVAAPFHIAAAAGFAGCITAYLLACLLATFGARSRINWQLLPLLPICFIILHISYGAGFIAGLFHFRKRWTSVQVNGCGPCREPDVAVTE